MKMTRTNMIRSMPDARRIKIHILNKRYAVYVFRNEKDSVVIV
jgi:hypothetical protein